MARTRTYADRVNVIKMIKIDGKWPFAPVIERNGKIVRDHVLVNSKDEHHPEGRYYLEWYEDGKKRRQPIEKFEEAVPAARAKFMSSRPERPASWSSSRSYRFDRRLRRQLQVW